jgi:hypothetical protein
MIGWWVIWLVGWRTGTLLFAVCFHLFYTIIFIFSRTIVGRPSFDQKLLPYQVLVFLALTIRRVESLETMIFASSPPVLPDL